MSLPTLPATITLDYQPYGCVTLSDLHWAQETAPDYNNGGGDIVRTVLRGTVVAGVERSYLFGHVATKSAVGRSETVYGVTAAEIERGHIVRIAG